jgi:integrase
MPKLTVAAVTKYAAKTKRREIRDDLAPSLYLIVQPTGTKQWALRFRRPDGKPAKLSLGRVDLGVAETADEPTIGGALSLRQARQLANQIDRERARGIDVVAARKAAQSRQRTAVADAAANSFGTVVIEFFRDHKTKRHERPRRWHGDARLLGLAWPPGCDPAKIEPEVVAGSLVATWVDRAVTAIDGHDVHAVVADARKNGIPGLAKRNRGVSEARGRKVHAALSVFFKWALQRRKVTGNPCVGVWHPGPPPSRTRVLTNEEIKAFWAAADTIGGPYGGLFKILLLTGCRLNETRCMKRSEIDADGVWTIPPARTKNHREHLVALPPLARAIIAAMAEVDGDHVFTYGRDPVNGFSRTKRKLDDIIGDSVPPWTLHDLRRTCATGMAEIGVAPHIIEAVLNHVSGAKAGVAGIYNRAAYAGEKRTALARWAAHVEGLVSDRPAAVVPMRKPRR